MHGRFSQCDASGADGGGSGGEIKSVGIWRADQGAGGSGGAGRNRSGVAGSVVAVRLHSGHWVGAGVGAAVPGERPVPVAVRRSGGEPPDAVGLSHRSGRGARQAVHAGDRDAGGSGTGNREPDEPGRRAGASERGSGKFSARGAVAKTASGEQDARRASAAAGGGAGEAVGRSGKEEGGAVASCRREAEARGAGGGAVAGDERATRRNRAPRRPGGTRAEDSGQAAAREYERSGSTSDEDGKRGIPSGVQRAVGDRCDKPRDRRGGGDERRQRFGRVERIDA